MRRGAVWGAAVAVLVAVSLGVSSGVASACTFAAPTPFSEVVAIVSGAEPAGPRIVGVVEFETVRSWSGIDDYTVAWVSVARRMWGDTTGQNEPYYRGGEYVGPSAITTGCVPPEAPLAGTREFFYVVAGSGPDSLRSILEDHVTPDHDAVPSEHLGESQFLVAPLIPEEYPRRTFPPSSFLEEGRAVARDDGPGDGTPLWGILAIVAALSVVAAIVLIVSLKRSGSKPR